MKNARISVLRDGLSESLARVRRGETVIVDDRDAPIARIEPEWKELADDRREIVSLETVRGRALRLLHVHALRGGDALRLASALIACGDRPDPSSFVCLEDRRRDAAGRKGFPLLP